MSATIHYLFAKGEQGDSGWTPGPRTARLLSTETEATQPEDAVFAQAILNTVSHADEAAAQGLLLRLSLVEQTLDEILADPYLPTPLRAPIEKLHVPSLRAAMTSDRFFTDPYDPIRGLLTEAADLAVMSRVGSRNGLVRNRQLLVHLAEDARRLVRPTHDQPLIHTPLGESVISSFLDQQRDAAARRREAVMSRARRVAAQEIETLMLGQRPEPEAATFLRNGWMPVMASRLLRAGHGEVEWEEALSVVQLTLSAFEREAEPDLVRRVDVISRARAGLLAAGNTLRRIDMLLAPLQSICSGAPPLAPKAQVVMSGPRLQYQHPHRPVLLSIVRPQSWFRVTDESGTRWLRVSEIDETRGAIVFVGFDLDRKSSYSFDDTLQHLATGQIQPISPSPEVVAAVEQLRERFAEARSNA